MEEKKVTPNANQPSPIAKVYDEVVDKNIERLVDIIKKIIEAFRNMGIGGGVTKQLEQLSKDIQEQAENGQIQNEVIDDLVTLTHEIDGKLETLTPDTVKEIMSFVEEKTQEITNKYKEKKIETEKIEPDFLTALKDATGNKDMSDKDFKELFDKSAIILSKDNNITDTLTVSFYGKNYDVSFNFEKDKNGKVNNVMKIKENMEDVSTYKQPEINAFLRDYSISSKIIITLANKQGFCTDTQAKLKIAKEMNKVFSSSVEKSVANFVSKRTDNVITSENGRFESTYNKNDSSLRIRDRSTSQVLVIAPQKSGKILLKTAKNVQDINRLPSGINKIGNIGYDDKTHKSAISIQISSQNVANLFRSKECMEFLGLNGIHKEDIDVLLNSYNKDNKGAYPVTSQGMENVAKLKTEIENELQKFDNKYKDFQVSIVQGKNKKSLFKKESSKGNSAVYLRITDCNNDVMSFAFRKDGMPSNICFKSKDEKQFHQVYNFSTKNINEVEKLQKNPEFALAFKLCKTATNNFAKKLSEPALAQGFLITEPIIPTITNIRNVPNELQIFSNPNNAMSIIPNKVAVYAPFTKDNVFSSEDGLSTVKKECFYAIMLDSIGMKSVSDKVWQSAMEKSMKVINKNAVDKSSSAVIAYKSSVYEALSNPDIAKQFINYTNSSEFNKLIVGSDVKIAMKKMYPLGSDSNIVSTINNDVNIAREKIVSELENNEPIGKGEGMTLALVSPDSFNDNENRAGFYFKGDIAKRLLNFNEITDMIFDLVDNVNIPTKNDNDEIEIKSFKTKVIIDELKKTMAEEGINVDGKGKITIDNTNTDFTAPKTMNLVASINNVIKSSFNGISKEFLDKLMYNNKVEEPEKKEEKQPEPDIPIDNSNVPPQFEPPIQSNFNNYQDYPPTPDYPSEYYDGIPVPPPEYIDPYPPVPDYPPEYYDSIPMPPPEFNNNNQYSPNDFNNYSSEPVSYNTNDMSIEDYDDMYEKMCQEQAELNEEKYANSYDDDFLK